MKDFAEQSFAAALRDVYTSPKILLVEIRSEKGFAETGGKSIDGSRFEDYQNGGDLGWS